MLSVSIVASVRPPPGSAPANPPTRKNYIHAAKRFLAGAAAHRLELIRITPGDVGAYFQDLPLAVPTTKLHLAALR
jgi:hypothetical protein